MANENNGIQGLAEILENSGVKTERQENTSYGNDFSSRNTETRTSFGSGSGFGRISNAFFGTTNSAIVQDAKKAFKDFISSIKDCNAKVIDIDKAQYPSFQYSSIVLADVNEGYVDYVVLMLTASGNPEKKVEEIVRELNILKQTSYKNTQVTNDIAKKLLLPYETFDNNIYKTAVEKELAKEFKQSKFRLLDILTVPTGTQFIANEVPTRIAETFFSAAFNAIVYNNKKLLDENGLNLIKATHEGNKDLIQSIYKSSTGTVDLIGVPKREDVVVEIKASSRNKNNTASINADDSDETVFKTSIFVEPILNTIERIVVNGQPPVKATRLQPNVVISNIETRNDTIRDILAAVASSVNIVHPDFLPYTIINNRNNIGAVEYITNVLGAEKPTAIDLKATSNTPEEMVNFIDMITEGCMPIVSIDLDHNELNPGLALMKYCVDSDINTSTAACKELVDAASKVFNGFFNPNFRYDDVFMEKTVLPTGYYFDRNGNKLPLDNIDISALIEYGAEKEDLVALNTLLQTDKGIDSYNDMIEILEKIGLKDAVITGKKTRAVFSSRFIDELITAIRNSKLFFISEPLVTRGRTLGFRGRDYGMNIGAIDYTNSMNRGYDRGVFVSPYAAYASRRNF